MVSTTAAKSISATSVRPTSYPIQAPFPYTFKDQPILAGFGRGSSDLGVPTANVPINPVIESLDTGVYYGWCRVVPKSGDQSTSESNIHSNNRNIEFNYGSQLKESQLQVLPMVMSIGWNPTYDDLREKALEIHIIHKFDSNFYGAHLDYVIIGFLRPELDFINIETLIYEINKDIEISKSLLEKEEQLELKLLLE